MGVKCKQPQPRHPSVRAALLRTRPTKREPNRVSSALLVAGRWPLGCDSSARSCATQWAPSVNIPVRGWPHRQPAPGSARLSPPTRTIRPPPSSFPADADAIALVLPCARALLPCFHLNDCLRVEWPTSAGHLINSTWGARSVSSSCLQEQNSLMSHHSVSFTPVIQPRCCCCEGFVCRRIHSNRSAIFIPSLLSSTVSANYISNSQTSSLPSVLRSCILARFLASCGLTSKHASICCIKSVHPPCTKASYTT